MKQSNSLFALAFAFPVLSLCFVSDSTKNSADRGRRNLFVSVRVRDDRNHPGTTFSAKPLFASLSDFPVVTMESGSSVDDSILWGVRLTSATLSYVGLVAFLDRPRGQLMAVPGLDIDVLASNVPGAGLGLFAKRRLPRGTILGTYPGVLLKMAEPNFKKVNKYPQCETYIWRFSDNLFVLDPTNDVGDLDDICVGGSPGNPGSFFLFKNTFQFSVPTYLCRINEPPRGNDVNVATEENLKERTVTFLLERDVCAGEEFFIDYGLTYDRSNYGPAK